MEVYQLKEITSGYADRVRRVALFDPLYELERKRERDQLDRPIDMKGLGLLTLLFFFEQKLMRQYKTGIVDLARFLRNVTREQYMLNEEIYEQLARSIVDTLRPAKKRTYTFFNWETGVEEEHVFTFLKAHDFDAKRNTQFYTLDEDGLELVFATKEFYSEFQLSISQLMLRKQLEKGEFRGALREINEMRIEMEALGDRIIKVSHEIQRNIVSEETFHRYSQLIEDIHERLERENEEFVELRQFVKETKERLYEENNTKQEQESYALILKVTTELEAVHYDHSRLLQKSMDLKNKTLAAAHESFYYTGIDSFNFDQDVVARIISTPLPFEAMEGILHPFLRIEQKKQWSLLTIFGKQTVTNREEEERENGFLSVQDNTDHSHEAQIVRENYGKLMELLLQRMNEEATITLRQFYDDLQESEYEWILYERAFYDFWMLLHQLSPVQEKREDDHSDDDQLQHLLSEVMILLNGRCVEVVELNELIESPRFTIQNMKLVVKESVVHEL